MNLWIYGFIDPTTEAHLRM